MNNQNINTNNSTDEDMLPEYDFSQGVRGKHHKQYQKGHTVTICYQDGTKTTEKIEPEQQDNIVILDPDVKKYFPDSESVNSTLRSLIKLIPTD